MDEFTARELNDVLTRPSPQAIAGLCNQDGNILFLGAGGKMGPSLVGMACRALAEGGAQRRVFAVSRFSNSVARAELESAGAETLSADLLDEGALAALPDARDVVLMTGFKFGASRDPSAPWGVNCLLTGLVCRRFAASRLTVFSTGNVYPLSPAAGEGPREEAPLHPAGEYALTAVGRERIVEYCSRRQGTPAVLLRLNYACEMRYGVLVDLGLAVRDGRPIDLAMGWVNALWQGDACAMALAALPHAAAPPRAINLAGPKLRVREVAAEFGRRLGREPIFTGEEQPDALLSDGRGGWELLGAPRVSPPELIAWTAEWLRRGLPTHGKPTQFQNRAGDF